MNWIKLYSATYIYVYIRLCYIKIYYIILHCTMLPSYLVLWYIVLCQIMWYLNYTILGYVKLQSVVVLYYMLFCYIIQSYIEIHYNIVTYFVILCYPYIYITCTWFYHPNVGLDPFNILLQRPPDSGIQPHPYSPFGRLSRQLFPYIGHHKF